MTYNSHTYLERATAAADAIRNTLQHAAQHCTTLHNTRAEAHMAAFHSDEQYAATSHTQQWQPGKRQHKRH